MDTGQGPLGLVGLSIKDCVSRMLSENYLKSWRTFSSTLYQREAQTPTDFLSIEQIHNNIHSATGGYETQVAGQGHMSDPAIAAFDPIFYLHHCNVDRQLAMWQTLNPTKWFDNIGPNDAGPKYRLEPFHKADGQVYTSDDVKDWTKLGYQYDNLEKRASRFQRVASTQQAMEASHEDIQASIRHSVNMHLNVSRHAVLEASEVAGKNNDYLVNVIYDRYLSVFSSSATGN
jgi:tyrosinase